MVGLRPCSRNDFEIILVGFGDGVKCFAVGKRTVAGIPDLVAGMNVVAGLKLFPHRIGFMGTLAIAETKPENFFSANKIPVLLFFFPVVFYAAVRENK